MVQLMLDVQGMVDPGEVVSTTVKREFVEEAMNSLALSEDDQNRLYQQIGDFFKKYTKVSETVVEVNEKLSLSGVELIFLHCIQMVFDILVYL